MVIIDCSTKHFSRVQASTVPKFKNVADRAIRFDAPWPTEILADISKGDFVMIDWAPYLDVVMKEQYEKTRKCDFSVSVKIHRDNFLNP